MFDSISVGGGPHALFRLPYLRQRWLTLDGIKTMFGSGCEDCCSDKWS